jgi:N-acetylmuramic acid 6-phosphate (MurNAc-6-P) etherase
MATSRSLLEAVANVSVGVVTVINQVQESLIERVRSRLDALQQGGHLSYSYAATGLSLGGANSGIVGTLTVQIDAAFSEAAGVLLSE